MSPASAPYSVAGEEQDSGRSAVAIVTVATSEWASYSCFVSHRRHARVIRTHHATFTGKVCVCVFFLSNTLVYNTLVLLKECDGEQLFSTDEDEESCYEHHNSVFQGKCKHCQ